MNHKYHHISKENYDDMVASYISGVPASKCAEKYNVPWWICTCELIRRGIPRHGKPRKYPTCESFFDEIDTEQKAYWLGFITADGNVCGDRLQIRLSSKDNYHLRLFLDTISPGRPVFSSVVRASNGKSYKTAHVSIVSKKIVNSLAKHGIVPRKSLSVAPCKNIDDNLIRHYWRGVFDGDGGISKIKSRNGAWRLDFVGSERMVSAFSLWVNSLSENKASVRSMGNIFTVSHAGDNTVPTVLTNLYLNSDVHLSRKYVLFERAMEDYGKGYN